MRRTCLTSLFVLTVLAPAAIAVDGAVQLYGVTTITQPGTYVVTRDLTVASGVVFVVDASDVVLDLNGHTITSAATTSPLISVSSGRTDIRVANGKLAGGAYGIAYQSVSTPTRIRIRDVDVTGSSSSAIYIKEAELVEVSGCRILSPGASGVFVSAYDTGRFSGRIVGNTIKHASFDAIRLDRAGGVVVADNVIEGFGGSAGIFSALVGIDPALANVIERNRISGGTGSADGIALGGSGGARIEDNVVQANAGDGIIAFAGHETIHHNTINGNLGIGIRVWTSTAGYVAITDNVVTGNGLQGIRLDPRGSLNEAFLIRGNLSSANGSHGIEINFGSGIIEDNVSTKNTGFGINFVSTTNNVYRNNLLRNNSSGPTGGAANTDGGGNY